MSVAIDTFLGVGLLGAFLLQLLRWLRVAQREHYVASSLLRFLARWSVPNVTSSKMARFWRYRPITLGQVLVVLLVFTLTLDAQRWAALDAIAYGVFCPVGLSIKGRTSSLDWTRRLKTIACVATVLGIIIVGAGLLSPRVLIAPTAVSYTHLLNGPGRLSSSPRSLPFPRFVAEPRARTSSDGHMDASRRRMVLSWTLSGSPHDTGRPALGINRPMWCRRGAE